MDKEMDKKWEELVDKLMNEAPLEQPSIDFTKNLMQKIEAETAQPKFEYQPIMSRATLVSIGVSFLALVVFLISKFGFNSNEGWFAKLKFDAAFDNVWGGFELYTSSKVLVYSVLLFGLLFFAQVTRLKRYFDKTHF
ncbi:hypothetical protein [Allomuricauda sp. NBRC 101325]|uniref:hypothetical protein n=1 Tax=Allomuricauda sp. NBRC 101325 TaxID=1113758 RepID=UPI0024A1A5F5|nr:hypothetical protein [Muricauda sp. NBRC 101325]GLU45632.1 hypothetical protein Musp01_32560 [Muricauda sp. NBRC 101325]